MHEYEDICVEIVGHVAVVEMRRPPYNFFDLPLMNALGQIFEDIDQDASLRAIVLGAKGSAFCAGADFNTPGGPSREVYPAAARLFATRKPVVAVFPFQNSTSEHIDSALDTVLSEAETWLLEAGTGRIVDRRRQGDYIREVIDTVLGKRAG